MARTPGWLLGLALSAIAFGLHAAALAHGALVLVQPVVVTGVVFAILIGAVLAHRRPSRAELGWAAVTWAGLGAFLVGTGAPVSSVAPHHAAAALIGTLAVAFLAGALARRRRARSTGKGLWLGVVSGVLFGLVAVLLKLALVTSSGGLVGLLTSWPIWAMALCGLGAVTVNQRAYQTSRLSVTMPILNIVDVLVALVLAAVVFGEVPSWTVGALSGGAAGLVLMASGVTMLARLEDIDADADAVPTESAPELMEVV
ncbi:MAG: DMT family transporter [Terrabacter sp.]